MEKQIAGHVIGVPVSSAAYTSRRSPKGYLLDTASQYLAQCPSYASTKLGKSKRDSVMGRMNKLGEKVDSIAKSIREHVRLGPKLTETMKGKLKLGTRILQVGGVEKVFKQNFSVRPGEELLKASQCYLSTTAGPIAGLLFISTDKLAFISERPIKLSSPTGEFLKVHYKVVIPLRKIQRVCQSENVKKPSSKYIEIVTMDNFDFWFMGFLNYHKTFKSLQQAVCEAQWIQTTLSK
ncbi:unnamed protein product [Ilex paraguariensis]|uniref:GRAM domain-containing protein n=1 Tax=Ilex paraguariensis TaxID=185542 RepID=A0ABC8UXA5_9AQUA